MSTAKVDVLAHRSATTVGEGPFWEEDKQTLSYVDIARGDIHQYNVLTKTDTKYHVGDGTVSFVIPCHSGGYIIGYNKTLALYDLTTGHMKTLVETEHEKNNRFNDGKCDPTGRLYAGTMHAVDRNLREANASLYSLETSGELIKRLEVATVSNGLAWTSDHQTMFYIDSTPRTIYAYDYEKNTGNLSNERIVTTFSEDMGFPDGMTIDTDDNIWVAAYEGGKVTQWDPKIGKLLREVEIPGAKNVTSCCFGGTHLDELFVTSGAYRFTEEKYKTQPNAGSLFKVTGLGVKGTPNVKYAGGGHSEGSNL